VNFCVTYRSTAIANRPKPCPRRPLSCNIPQPLSQPANDDDEKFTISHEKTSLFPISPSLPSTRSSSILSHHGECRPFPSRSPQSSPDLSLTFSLRRDTRIDHLFVLLGSNVVFTKSVFSFFGSLSSSDSVGSNLS